MQFYMSCLFYCINIPAVFILILLTQISITSCSVLLLLHSVQLLCLLHSWCIMSVFHLHVVMCLFSCLYIAYIMEYFNNLLLTHVPGWSVDCWSKSKDVPMWWWQEVHMWGNLPFPRWSWYYIVAVSAMCALTKQSCRTQKSYSCKACTVNVVSEQATKTDVGTGLWNCSTCAQSYRKNISYREISNGNVEWSCDEELGSPTCVWHGVLCIHPTAVSEEIRQQEHVWSNDLLPE